MCNEVNFSHEQFTALNEKLRDAVCVLEDVLEFRMSSLLLSHHPNLRSDDSLNLYIDFEEVKKKIVSFISNIKEIKKQYSSIIRHSGPEQFAVCNSLGRTVFNENNSSELVGLVDELEDLKSRVMSDNGGLNSISIYGMAGIGKTALAKAVCQDFDVWHHFDYHLFVPIGPNYLLKNALVSILSQLNHGSCDHIVLNIYNENKLAKRVTELLNHKRYIILLDDVWSERVWNDFRKILPDNTNGSRVLQTTRLYDPFPFLEKISYNLKTKKDRYKYSNPFSFPFSQQNLLEKRFLDEVESWDLLCKKIFTKDSCTYELKKLGKKIAKKCEGLPLALISVGNHLAKAEKTKEYWEDVLQKGITSIIGADEGLLETLHPSYVHLDEYSKALFLYLGIFQEYFEISGSKLIKLWSAEQFLEPNPTEKLETHAQKLLNYFAINSIVMVKQQRTIFTKNIKTCQLHIVYWTYCKIQASKENLFRILHTRDDCFVEGVERQRRLCIHNNSLFGIKDSYNAMASVSSMHSLLCTGPYHKYPVPFCLGFKLLRTLDAVTIRFYKFPLEVLKLVLLRYMAFTYDGDLPPSIYQVLNLWYLIVHRQNRVIFPKCPSYLPKEIWKMKELRHLQVMGSDLPEPTCGELLPNLLKLLDVTPQSCTKIVLESLPNLKKLGVQIVLPRDTTEPICSLDCLENLNGLLSLQCTVLNPKPSSGVAARAYPTSVFPKSLKKLSLSGFGYSWCQISEISIMADLQMLKLRHCAFQGPRGVIGGDFGELEFRSLRFLLLEDIDLQYFNVYRRKLSLDRAIIKHCYKLEQFPWESVQGTIEIVDCRPSLVSILKRYRKCTVVSSWEERKDVGT